MSMPPHSITISSRKSPLAMWQSEHVKKLILTHHPELKVDISGILTQGDKLLATPLNKIGGKGLFVKELEKAILERRADIAVHSIKDMPMELPDGLELAIICARGETRDAFVSNDFDSLDALPAGAVVGTSSLRRQCLILNARPDVIVKPVRGNVGTRLSKLDEGQFDAIILAAAGLTRLGLQHRITDYFSHEQMLPAAGQGAMGVECRLDDEKLIDILQPLHDPQTAYCVTAERAVTQGLGGSCQVPIAAHASIIDGQLELQALVGRPDGSEILEAAVIAAPEQARTAGEKVVQDLISQGAEEILRECLGDQDTL